MTSGQKQGQNSVGKDKKRDQLWETTTETFYDTYYEEIASDYLIRRWEYIDEIAKVVIAITASGSAVSGWALWGKPVFKVVWVIAAGIGAVLAILHATLVVQRRLRDYANIKIHFARLRTDIETFRAQMRIDPDFSLEDFTQTFLSLRQRFSEGTSLLKNDILLTKKLCNKAQDDLDKRLENEFESI